VYHIIFPQHTPIGRLLNSSIITCPIGVADLGPSAFLASSYLVRPLVSLILQPIALARFDSSLFKALSYWSSKCSSPPPSESLQSIQHAWDNGTCSAIMHNFLASSTGADRAHLFVSSGCGAWFPAVGPGFESIDWSSPGRRCRLSSHLLHLRFHSASGRTSWSWFVVQTECVSPIKTSCRQ